MTRSSVTLQQTPPLLVVEDSNEDFEALQRLLQRSSLTIPIQRCVNGDQALAFLYRTGHYQDHQISPRPGLIVLDLNLPGTDGRDVLRRIKQDETLKKFPLSSLQLLITLGILKTAINMESIAISSSQSTLPNLNEVFKRS